MSTKISHALLIFSFFLCIACSPAGSGEQPNFLWIISEDNSKHYLELFDPHGMATPHIEQMAREGIQYTRAFSNAPVCSVARSTLISACYGPRTGAQFHRRSKRVPLPGGVEMFPAYLKKAGYYTSNNSKEDYNYIKGEAVWDESSREAHWTKKEAGQPFFHMESHPVSHESRLHFPDELMDTYQAVTDPSEVHVFPNHPDTDLFRFTGAYYRDRMLVVDSIVGRVIKELEDAGELESTFVFYFGDHGGVLPGSKGYAYESGLHVPLVVRVPEKFRHLVKGKRGAVSEEFVSFIDFGPTLLKLAGIEIPYGIDGAPFLGKDRSRKNDDFSLSFGYADRFDEKYDMVRTLRRGQLKYMRSYQPFNVDGLQNNYRYRCLAYQQWRELFHAGKLNEVQSQFFQARDPEALYDLDKDPYETHNLAEDPAYAGKLLEMRSLMGEWVRGMPDLSFYPENYLFAHAFDDPPGFGQEHSDDIVRLIDVADLQLLPIEEARERIQEVLTSGNPLDLYWGMIVCSTFGAEAGEFAGTAEKLCGHEDLLVRTRAAEFLGLTSLGDPVPVIRNALYECKGAIEALLILNTLVLLQDGPYEYDFVLEEDRLAAEIKEHREVQRRLKYIQGRIQE